MKKLIISLGLILLTCFGASAIIAPKTPYKYTQPDGSTITLVNHGDEFHSWTTTPDGTVVAIDKDGFFRPVSNAQAAMKPSAAALQMRAQAEAIRNAARQSAMGMGSKKFIVVLVEFSDLTFTVSNAGTAFSNLLNQEGYSANGGTGSARDFYISQSLEKFTPTFDVYGPVKVSKNYAYYGEQQGSTHDMHPDEAFFEAVQKLDSSVDFSQYDNDNNGVIDNFFFYYAGHNQAEGGGVNTIWPHQWSFYNYQASLFDGKRLGSYACTSEYRGSSGTSMAGIGTFCHEFGHVIGLPDFYDTDYESHGSARTIYSFSTMCNGPYLNNGRTPSNFTALERNMLGWADFPTQISTAQKLTIDPVSTGTAYYTATDVKDEIFIVECRDGKGWDRYLPTGMVVYHMDRSKNVCHDGVTASAMWNGNSINAYEQHPCYYVIPSNDYTSESKMIFPSGNKKSYVPISWSGYTTPYQFTNITFENGVVTTDVAVTESRRIYGVVTNVQSQPIEGVSILVSKSQSNPNDVAPRADRYSTTSAEDGTYEILIDSDDNTSTFTLTAYKEGYKLYTKEVTVQIMKEENILLKVGDSSGDVTLSTIGYNSIRNSKAATGYNVGDTFVFGLELASGKTPTSTLWTFDGVSTNAPSKTLNTAGIHVVKAVLTYADGTSEEITLELVVN